MMGEQTVSVFRQSRTWSKGRTCAIKHSSLSRTGKTLLKILESNFDLLVLTIESEAQGYRADRS